MKVVDLHPEELIDKEARGELAETDRARLEAHLARCETCRFELQVRADFAEDLAMGEGDDGDVMSSQQLIALVEGTAALALRASEKEAALTTEDEEELVASSRRGWRSRRPRAWLLAVAALFAVGAASATTQVGGHAIMHFVGLETESEVSMPRTNATFSAPPPAPVRARTVDVPEPTVRAPLDAPPAAPSESVIIPVSHVTHVVAQPVTAVVSPPIESPASVFDEANDARRRGDYGRALDLTQKLQSRWPSSREAHVSRATMGRLLLDRGNPSGALASFDAYEAGGGGELDEAVWVGRATALERLGRNDEARVAWQKLLTAFPHTPYADHARARLEGSSPR